MKVIRFILRNLDQYRTVFILVALASMANGVAVFLIPVILAQFADGTITAESAMRVCATVALLYGLSLLFAYIVRSCGEALAFKFLKRELADKTLIVVTHRPALRELCGRYYEMKLHTLVHKSN